VGLDLRETTLIMFGIDSRDGHLTTAHLRRTPDALSVFMCGSLA
jgi:hypothetical protein